MIDRELLELAAKAAGIEHPGGEHSVENDGRLWDCKELRWWNPLTDDGDALRLAVKLKICIYSNNCVRVDYVRTDWIPTIPIYEEFGDDPYAATRRAIVRAAAEIGRGLRPFPSVEEIERFANMDDKPEHMK